MGKVWVKAYVAGPSIEGLAACAAFRHDGKGLDQEFKAYVLTGRPSVTYGNDHHIFESKRTQEIMVSSSKQGAGAGIADPATFFEWYENSGMEQFLQLSNFPKQIEGIKIVNAPYPELIQPPSLAAIERGIGVKMTSFNWTVPDFVQDYFKDRLILGSLTSLAPDHPGMVWSWPTVPVIGLRRPDGTVVPTPLNELIMLIQGGELALNEFLASNAQREQAEYIFGEAAEASVGTAVELVQEVNEGGRIYETVKEGEKPELPEIIAIEDHVKQEAVSQQNETVKKVSWTGVGLAVALLVLLYFALRPRPVSTPAVVYTEGVDRW